MLKYYKTVSACLVAVFLISCVSLSSFAEGEQQPTTGGEVITTLEQPSQTGEDVTGETETGTTEPIAPETTEFTVQYSAIIHTTASGNGGGYVPQNPTQKKTTTKRNESLTKTTKAIKTTKPTTVKKNVTDYGRTSSQLRWIPIILMILSAGGLIAVNTVNYRKTHPVTAAKRRRPRK